MVFLVKSFGQLSGKEVYEILKARSDVFMTEQGIRYPDMDDIDYRSLHVWMQDDSGLVLAYLRLYDKEDEPGIVKMGRVLTREHGKGIGRKLVSAGIKAAHERMNARGILLDSQEYCTGFYEKLGFKKCSDAFMEAGIPHVQMIM
ncbi:MAG: GNAT family N-acetyltransferase [Bacteroidales bacterium]|nr:GNAT family N-acetyltransferase [Bacteroidales bacterium]